MKLLLLSLSYFFLMVLGMRLLWNAVTFVLQALGNVWELDLVTDGMSQFGPVSKDVSAMVPPSSLRYDSSLDTSCVNLSPTPCPAPLLSHDWLMELNDRNRKWYDIYGASAGLKFLQLVSREDSYPREKGGPSPTCPLIQGQIVTYHPWSCAHTAGISTSLVVKKINQECFVFIGVLNDEV
jgi:hypothetical protein